MIPFEAWTPTSFSPWVRNELTMHFYRPARLELHPFAEVDHAARSGAAKIDIVAEGGALPPPPEGYGCALRYRSLPEWVRAVEVVGGRTRLPDWSLYRCQKVASR